MDVFDDRGTYALIIALATPTAIEVGRLGRFAFPAGYYVYVGSAQGGLRARVRRHLRGEKRLRWHIDYLLAHAEVVEVWYAHGAERVECQWNRAVQRLPRAQAVAPRFGSSDCRCSAHLTHFPAMPSLDELRRGLGMGGKGVQRAAPASFL